MGISLAHQTQTFFVSCMIGVGFGIGYDCIRIARKAVKHAAWGISLEDACFFLLAAWVSFYFMLNNNMGEVRGFVLAGELLGLLFYQSAFSRAFLGIGTDVAKVLSRVLKLAEKLIFCPILRIFGGVFALVLIPVKIIKKLVKKIRLRAKIILKRQRIMLYNLFAVKIGQSRIKKHEHRPFADEGGELNGSEKTG